MYGGVFRQSLNYNIEKLNLPGGQRPQTELHQ